jgi:anti-sigma B factor antagonist
MPSGNSPVPAKEAGRTRRRSREDVLKLKCLNCGLTVPHKGSRGHLCPRCLVREEKAVQLITISDRPSTPSGRSAGRLRILTSVDGSRHTLTLSGELDIASAQVLGETLAEACSAGASEVVLDLAGIDFMDSEGLNAILHGRALCEQHGCSYSLTPAQRPVQRVLEVTGLLGKLPFRRAVHKAVPKAVPKQSLGS